MFRKMTDLGYSLRQLAQKIGKDKGYIENRLRLAEAPAEIRELVSLRKDTMSHAYELMKVRDERKRRRLEEAIVAGELSLAKFGHHRRRVAAGEPTARSAKPKRRARRSRDRWPPPGRGRGPMGTTVEAGRGGRRAGRSFGQPRADRQIPEINRVNFAKHLTITKLKIENAIAIIRAGTARRASNPSGGVAHHLALADEEVDQLLPGPPDRSGAGRRSPRGSSKIGAARDPAVSMPTTWSGPPPRGRPAGSPGVQARDRAERRRSPSRRPSAWRSR